MYPRHHIHDVKNSQMLQNVDQLAREISALKDSIADRNMLRESLEKVRIQFILLLLLPAIVLAVTLFY